MEGKKTVERDWASLPHEVLNLIAKNLTEIFDFVRFRAVCTSWFSSTPITDCPPQFPWILDESMDGPNMRFYSIPFNKLFTIHSPKFAIPGDLFELVEGYMPILQNNQLFLLNLLSNHEIQLPSYDFDSTGGYWFKHRKNRMGESVVFCGIYDSDPNFRMVFCKVGQDNWHVLNLNSHIDLCNHFYLNDMIFYVEKDTGATKVIDTTTGSLACVVPPPVENHVRSGFVYLVETSGGILRFFQHGNQSRVFSRNDLFDVHQLDVGENGSPCWIEVKNIGNYAFFINMRDGFVLKADSSARIKANSIYFLEDICLGSGACIYQVRRINIETCATELLPFPFKSPTGWFVPILHH